MFSFFTRNPKRPAPRCSPRRPSFRPRLEGLEDRCLLSAGAFDPTFGSGGIVTVSFGSNLVSASGAEVIQPADGKIIAAGDSINPKSLNVGYIDLVRYNTNGTLDSTFGSGGKVQTKFSSRVQISSIVLQPDGKIVVGGKEGNDFLLARYNPTGSIDTTFGTKGIVTTAFGSLAASTVHGLATQTVVNPQTGLAQTDIVAVGGAYDPNVNRFTTGSFALARYNPNGSLDASFGSAGTVLQDVSPGNDILYGVAIDPTTNEIVVTGQVNNGTDPNTQPGFFAVARYNVNGTPDATFGSGGIVLATFINSYGYNVAGQGNAVTVLADGSIVAAGNINDEAAVVRLNPDGSLASTFGQGGMVLLSGSQVPTLNFSALAVAGNGQIVVSDGANSSSVLARLNTDGSLDSTFGTGGIATPNLGGGITDLVIQADGNIDVTVYNGNPNSSPFEEARILGA